MGSRAPDPVPGQWDASFLAQLLAQFPVGRGTYAFDPVTFKVGLLSMTY